MNLCNTCKHRHVCEQHSSAKDTTCPHYLAEDYDLSELSKKVDELTEVCEVLFMKELLMASAGEWSDKQMAVMGKVTKRLMDRYQIHE